MSNQTETTRQQKIGRQIQRDMSEILQRETAGLALGTLVSVTRVRMSPDLSLAKIYVSIFPFDKHAEVMENLNENIRVLRKLLGDRVKHQLRHVPELAFYVDDSLEYISEIDKLLQQ